MVQTIKQTCDRSIPADSKASNARLLRSRNKRISSAPIVGSNRHGDDVLKIYLSEIGRYQLLSREEEKRVAEGIEERRRAYRRRILSNELMLQFCVEQLQKVESRELRFETVFNLSPRDRKKASEIRKRLAANLSTIQQLISLNRDELQAIRQHHSPCNQQTLRPVIQRRRKAVALMEELHVRTKFLRETWNQVRNACESVEEESPSTKENEDSADRHHGPIRDLVEQFHMTPTRFIKYRERVISAQRRLDYVQQEFANHNLRLVVSVAKQFKSTGVPFGDLIQEGSIGLLKAIEKYEPGRGYKFSTYATWWIKEMIRKGVSRQSRTIRITETGNELLRRVNRQIAELKRRNRHEISPGTIDSQLRLTYLERQGLRAIQQPPISLSRPPEDMDDYTDAIPDYRNRQLIDVAHTLDLRDQMFKSLATQKERDKEILLTRFGLNGDRPRTLEAVAEQFSLSRERIRQIERDMLKKLASDLIAFNDRGSSVEDQRTA